MVIVVDDDEDIRDTFRDLIRLRGYTVAVAKNGQEALDLLQQGPEPCVILLDLVMPVMDGWQLLAQLQVSTRLRNIPVVVISAHAVGVAPLAGVHKVLRKPIEPAELYSAVAEHCDPPS